MDTGYNDNSRIFLTESQEERKEKKKNKKEWYRPWIDHATGTHTPPYTSIRLHTPHTG